MSKQQGDIAELQLKYLAAKQNFIVSVPFGSPCYDLILDAGDKPIRVQVKSTTQNSPDTPNDCYRFNISKGSSSRSKYTSDEIDVFALYIFPLNLWYFVPVKIINKSKSVRIYPNKDDDRFTHYRYNWDIFRSLE